MPFSGYTDRDIAVMVSSGKRPSRPRRFEAPGITPEVWSIAKRCWHERAEERPNAEAVLQDLRQITNRNGEHVQEVRSYPQREFIDLWSE